MANRLENMRVAAIMTNGFEQIEFTSPRDALRGEGAIVHLISPAEGQVHGWHHLEKGDRFDVDVPIDQANPDDYDAVLLPGGVINGDSLRTNEAVHNFLRQINDDNKPIFVMCHGPWTLISAGLVRGRRMTSYHTLKDDMVNAGAQWVDEPAVIDDNFISSRHPGDLEQFNKAIADMLSQHRERHAEREGYLAMPTEGIE